MILGLMLWLASSGILTLGVALTRENKKHSIRWGIGSVLLFTSVLVLYKVWLCEK